MSAQNIELFTRDTDDFTIYVQTTDKQLKLVPPLQKNVWLWERKSQSTSYCKKARDVQEAHTGGSVVLSCIQCLS